MASPSIEKKDFLGSFLQKDKNSGNFLKNNISILRIKKRILRKNILKEYSIYRRGKKTILTSSLSLNSDSRSLPRGQLVSWSVGQLIGGRGS